MRHQVSGYKLGRSKAARIALRRNLIKQFFTHERIQTTRAKAAAIRGEAERLIRARRRGLKIGVKDVPHLPRRGGKASGARPALILEAVWDMLKCWFDMFVFRRT